ncbi:MAG: pyridoxal phosphate-dependent aminotransferase family protein [Verrucomicrobia bacterium]|nr:pyridoxal phosphate-dependent aminotransferase family protein [Verrucomicrobiota bacterium]
MPAPPELQTVNRTFVLHHGRKFSFFGGCDYFRLSSHPRVRRAVRVGLKQFGLNVAASRATTGNHALYGRLERTLADFFGADDAVLTASGYTTNLIVAQALAGEFTHVLLDEKAHASLADAAGLFRAPVKSVVHFSVEDMARAARCLGKTARPIVLTDGLFSHDGTVAPLRAYLKILPPRAMLLVDDAHGAGVMGATGRGSLEHEGVSRRRVIQTVTLSKAFGVYGGAILGPRDLRGKILRASRAFIGGTPLPLPLAAGALEAVRVLQSDGPLRARLFANADYLRHALRAAGFIVANAPGPTVSVVPANRRATEKIRRALRARKIYPPFIQYPGGPPEGYFRFVVSSEHTAAQLRNLKAALLDAVR